MSHPGFGHLWKQAETSDIDIVLSIVRDVDPAGDETSEAQARNPVLQQFPGHSLLLSVSPFFAAQVRTL